MTPGGGFEPGETPEECIRREMREETGLEVQIAGVYFLVKRRKR
jgi:ADP-ribose pyrophosphatase YjhB (NUDIX family)